MMCEWGRVVNVALCVPKPSGRTSVPVDFCIAELVSVLNRLGVATETSCCGHGKEVGEVLVADGTRIEIPINSGGVK